MTIKKKTQSDIPLTAQNYYKYFDTDVALRDLFLSIAYLRQLPKNGFFIGTIGFCCGARLAFLLTARTDINCAVCYDNLGLESVLNEASDIIVPVLFHFGDNNKLVPKPVIQKIQQSLSYRNKMIIESYPSAGHGFYLKNSPHYNPEEAKKAEEKTLAFLENNLTS